MSNDDLKGKVVLKGGTAINLTVFDMPCLSVDIDLDYCINSDKDTIRTYAVQRIYASSFK